MKPDRAKVNRRLDYDAPRPKTWPDREDTDRGGEPGAVHEPRRPKPPLPRSGSAVNESPRSSS